MKKPFSKINALTIKHFAIQKTLKMIIIFLFPMILFVISISLFNHQNYYSIPVIWLTWPISFLFLIGSLKDRLLNTLPLFAILIYLLIGINTGDFESASAIYFFVPLLSLLLKPKKHRVKYITMLVSFIILMINYFTSFDIPVVIKYLMIICIYILYLPPILTHQLNKIKHAKEEA
ncbi:MAG: hypothetical protein AB7E61_03555 [Acholeplasmataceae bacterium]